jgi:hypothetical protein
MKKFFHSHPDVVIGMIAIVLLAAVVGCYAWAINDIYAAVHGALVTTTPPSSDEFDLQDAARLDLRGVSTSSAPVSTTTPPPPPAQSAGAASSTTAASSSATAASSSAQ